MTCVGNDHNFVNEGVRFREGEKLPGSGARSVEYFDSYFCTKCLSREMKSMGVQGNSYGALLYNARPMPAGQR